MGTSSATPRLRTFLRFFSWPLYLQQIETNINTNEKSQRLDYVLDYDWFVRLWIMVIDYIQIIDYDWLTIGLWCTVYGTAFSDAIAIARSGCYWRLSLANKFFNGNFSQRSLVRKAWVLRSSIFSFGTNNFHFWIQTTLYHNVSILLQISSIFHSHNIL